MRRLAPYLGIALAVAAGVALAPYFGWLAVGTILFLAFCVACALIQRGYGRLARSAKRVMAALVRWFDQTPV